MIITLLTDFGWDGPYVGAMKGAVLSVAPGATLADISHGVPPQDVAVGALVLGAVWPYFPAGTVHAVVVDPGVGSEREGIAAQGFGHYFVGPNNGLFSRVFSDREPDAVVALTNPRYHRPEVSDTFHGRDIFGPVAAHLALGVPMADFGPPTTLVHLPSRLARSEGPVVCGEVLYVDHFGNLLTNITRLDLGTAGIAVVEVGDCRINGIVRTYADLAPGQLAALWGSFGTLEIAVNQGSAAQALGVVKGDVVRVVTAR